MFRRLLTSRNVSGLFFSTGAGLDVELHQVAFRKGFVPIVLNSAVMDENVRPAFTRKEAESLYVVKPHNLTDVLCHLLSYRLLMVRCVISARAQETCSVWSPPGSKREGARYLMHRYLFEHDSHCDRSVHIETVVKVVDINSLHYCT